MRYIFVVTLMFLICLVSCGQKPATKECELQDVAIDAALGDPVAQHDIGVAFYTGNGVTQDYGKAAIMWQKACDGGNIQAFNNLGYLNYYGKGIKQNFAEGIRLWTIAAEKGVAESQFHIGQAYFDGKYLKNDFVEAYAWTKTSKYFAEQKDDKDTLQLAEKLLTSLKGKMSETQMLTGEKRASEYISKFSPK